MVKVKEFFKKLRHIDFYSKPDEESTIRTYEGAAGRTRRERLTEILKTFVSVSILSVFIMVILFMIELNDFLAPNVTEELFVDTSRSPILSLDAMDSSGEQHLMLQRQIYKRRLDLNGKPIEEPKSEDVPLKGNELVIFENKTENCGSCYGAADRCCNTCEDVKEAYRNKKWAFDPKNITQCQNEHYSEKLKNAFNEGCQIYGSLTVNRVAGSFHIAPGHSFLINHIHVHDVQPFSSSSFNTSHRIRHLSFGRSIRSATTNPLDNTQVFAEEGAMMYQYHIKIVPTAYMRHNGSMLYTNQFSVTRHQKPISILNGESGMPGVFFNYELSPLMVKYTERKRSFGHFLTNVCAIIGGVYTVASLIDSFLYRSINVIKKKIELGKAN